MYIHVAWDMNIILTKQKLKKHFKKYIQLRAGSALTLCTIGMFTTPTKWVWCTFQEFEGLSNIADKKALCVWCTFDECEGLSNIGNKKEPCGCGVLSRM